MPKVLIIAKFADVISQKLLDRKLTDFVLQDSVYDSFTGKTVGVKEYYSLEDRALAEKHLNTCKVLNLTVGYEIVEVEIK